MPICRSCTAPIRFIRTRKGEAMPVDPHPDSTGTVAAQEVVPGKWIDAYVVSSMKPKLPGYRLFVPHFATCDRRPSEPKPDLPAPPQDGLF